MLLNRTMRTMLIAASAFLAGSSSVQAAGGEPGSGSVGFRLGYYHNDDSGDGNPFLDEELTVIEPVIVFDYNVSKRSTVWGKLSYDYVSSASIDRLSEFPDQSGASGDYYIGADVGIRHQYADDLEIGGFAGLSTEYDYTSFALGGDVTRELPERNASLKLSLNGFLDQIDVIRFDGAEEGSDNRTSISGTVDWYQIINPETHGEIGLTLSHQNGFLETAYNAVVIEDGSPPNPNLDNMARGMEVTEELPDTRTRLALFGRVRKYVEPGQSIELGARLYGDDWGITSIALEPRYYRWLIDDKLMIRLRYRFYTQTAADAYDEHFTRVESERTQDSDLADFVANTLGFKLDWYFNEATKLDLGVDYILRSDGLDQLLGSIGWTKNF